MEKKTLMITNKNVNNLIVKQSEMIKIIHIGH